MLRNTLRAGALVLAACGLGAAMAAHADPITYQFSGQLTTAPLLEGSANPEWRFETGQTFTGTLVYDTDLIASHEKIVDQAGWRVDRYSSPIASLSYQIDLGAGGTYNYVAPLAWDHALISSGTDPYGWNGAEMRTLNYNWDGTPIVPMPAESWVGAYHPHSAFLTMLSAQPLASTDPDLDLIAMFATRPESGWLMSIRFSDPANWQVGYEHLDGVIDGRIDRFWVVQTGVPEPATWLAMIGGMGIAGAALRRRREGRAALA